MLEKTASDPRFPKLFSPGYIGQLWVKNRLIKSPSCTRFADTQGFVTDRLISHYRELAKGGSGLIIMEHAYIDEKSSQTQDCQLSISRDAMLPGLDWLAATIKDNGARACQQISHAGMVGLPGKSPVKAASPVPWPAHFHRPTPEELTIEEIKEVVEAFGDAALRVKKAGFDMVEVHGAHGYLITNFLSPHYNKRADRYGGSLLNRMRLLLEIVDNIRKKVGKDFPMSVRLSVIDYESEEPITIEETKEVANALEEACVNIINVSSGVRTTVGRDEYTMYSPRAAIVWAAEEIKKVVSIPVIAVRSITTPDLAEKILAEGKADFVALGRPLLTDPYYPLKAKEGRPEDIRPCIRCTDGCFDRGINVGSVKCSVNPTLGREDELRMTLVSRPKRVAVIGGGPAGMEAARVAALRGHEVTLFEKNELGGMLIPASVPEFKSDIRTFIKYLSTQISKAGINLVKCEATCQTIKDGKFDAVIVATGAMPLVPDIEGIKKASVLGVLDVFYGARTGKHIIVVGGGLSGSDVALFLAEQGKKVTIIEMLDEIAQGLSVMERVAFFMRLSKQDVDIRTEVHLEEVTDSGIIVSDKSGKKSEIDGDNVVIAAGLTPNRRLFDNLVQLPDLDKVYAVGDCVEPRTIFEAVHEGHAVAFNL